MNTRHFLTDRLHLSDEGTALYVDAISLEMTARLPDEVRRHVEGCEPCQRKVIELRDLMQETGYAPARPHPYLDRTILERRTPVLLYRAAAVVAGIGLLGAGYYAIISSSTPPPALVSTPNTAPQQAPEVRSNKEEPSAVHGEKLLAADFTENANLEDMVHNQFRSVSVEVLTPSNGDVVTVPVTFRWEHIDEPVTMKILTNKERTILSAEVHGDSYVAKKKLAPGLYYWKLETKDELLFVGKFLVQ